MVVQLSYLTNRFSEFFVQSDELLCYQQEFDDFPKKVSGGQTASSLNKILEVSEWAERRSSNATFCTVYGRSTSNSPKNHGKKEQADIKFRKKEAVGRKNTNNLVVYICGAFSIIFARKMPSIRFMI